ncbi:MAG TPA: MotA/TolQ/ExbB proton channel family protein [Candidatus Methanoculleus thermohydrogenotrophicum]|jgi:biopolymer transport protein ExbB/TolQ|nr:MotA/TolQ/ExbB proton channel family protein [Candidatus Methanoculleus thermohydrogenotrophicum]HOB17678.1 MotA/TolQ/ExbB proton channel family protein [Candidatus Methanoculleus thermohydrogenotrophicum]HPZ37300.1 MotA/TolQ/ExbB proton channel family protein [Candidatus Methanoculleus thermohydrogenotrophicum]HQC91182.1 MotA/TolQ/ExbB proton channel family protein [Candidatus Methanoculleus thermohydrogenotrophicum]
MDLSALIMETMFTISGALLYPAIILLLVFVVWALAALGQFISEYSGRTRNPARLRAGCRDARTLIEARSYDDAAETLAASGSNPLLGSFIGDLAKLLGDDRFSVESEKLLQDYEIRIAAELEWLKILTRTAPMLGLMGTLIPLGPALMGLSSGNIEALASNLIIAFSTTVLGLFAGGIAYTVMLTKRRWYLQDLSDMEYIVRMVA